MPTIYRIECTNCGQSPKVKSVTAGWVTTDGRKGGIILPEGYLSLKLSNGEYIDLPHPIEASVLKKNGFTWQKASQQSRLFRVTFKICTQCGMVQEERQHQNSRSGCLAGLFAAIAVFFLLKFWLKHDWGFSFFMGYLVLMSVFRLAELANWLRWQNRNQNLKLKTCAGCDCGEFKTISQMVGKSWPCLFCKTSNMKYTVAGKS